MVVLVTDGDGGEDAAGTDAQLVRFQKPTDPGDDPFTRPVDVRGEDRVEVGSGPFGGTGSDLVCDRELLIRSLRARPDRLREWARVAGVRPTAGAVARYIRGLEPVTLTRDTRVTNHFFVDGKAVAYQAILQAGTAVLVDSSGKPVARCRCGNPLLEPTFIKVAKCLGCPPRYKPPPPCEGDECYEPYPDPPPVKTAERPRTRTTPTTPTTPAEPARNPAASFNPTAGRRGDSFVLSASGFRPNTTLQVRLVRPDGVVERYTIRTNSAGSGSHSFPPTGDDTVLGVYTATVSDPGTGDSTTASTRLLPRAGQAPSSQQPQTQTTPSDQLQCDPPRSQEEFELCQEVGR